MAAVRRGDSEPDRVATVLISYPSVNKLYTAIDSLSTPIFIIYEEFCEGVLSYGKLY